MVYTLPVKFFKRLAAPIISNIQDSANSQDDIVIYGKTLVEHGNCLQMVLLKEKVV